MGRPSPGCAISCLSPRHSRRWPASASTPCDRGATHARYLAAGAAAVISACLLWDAASCIGCILTRTCPTIRWSAAWRAPSAATTSTTGSTACPRRSGGLRPTATAPLETEPGARLFGGRVRRARDVRPHRHASAAALGFQAGVERSEFFIAPTHMNCDRISTARSSPRREVRSSARLCEGPAITREAADGDRSLAVGSGGHRQGKLITISHSGDFGLLHQLLLGPTFYFGAGLVLFSARARNLPISSIAVSDRKLPP